MTGKSSEYEYRVDPAKLHAFVEDVLLQAGVTEENANRVAHALVRADLRGVDSHGVARLETYVNNFEGGGFNADPDIETTRLTESTVLVDGDDGPGQSAGVVAIDAAMDCAEETGIGIGAVTNSNHFGTAAYYTERASEEGFIGLAMTNVGPDVAPFGGVSPLIGTNPISFSIPTDRDFAMTLDMATSVVARGKIDHASESNDEIPADWGLDENGQPTTSPDDVVALRPLGGPKGFGLALVVDVFCGLLTGAGVSPTVGALYDNFADPMDLGHFVAAIDVETFRPLHAFQSAVGSYIDQIKNQPTQEGIEEIRVPGEIEAMNRQQNEERGVPINTDAGRGIRSLAERYDISPPERLN